MADMAPNNIFMGAKSAPLPRQEEYGLGAAVILELESRLPKELGPYNFYFDNFFTSLPLLSALSENKTGGTGTIRGNRLAKCPITQVSVLKKETREDNNLRNNPNRFENLQEEGKKSSHSSFMLFDDDSIADLPYIPSENEDSSKIAVQSEIRICVEKPSALDEEVNANDIPEGNKQNENNANSTFRQLG
ncbi:hypothetical protein ILUMI_15455, partial [Ignelater luminosus]